MDSRRADRHYVGQLEEFEIDSCRIVQAKGREVGIIRTDDGVYAIRNHCPHMGAELCKGTVTGTVYANEPGELEYREDEKAIRCPWHRWEFYLDSGLAVGGITNRRVKTFEVAVEEGAVYVVT